MHLNRQENSVYSNKVSSLNAAQELEKLMASLTMYKVNKYKYEIKFSSVTFFF